MKIARYVEQLTRRSSEYIYKLPFTMSNRVERFKHVAYVMPYPRAVIYTSYYYA